MAGLQPTAVNAILAEVRATQAQGKKLVSLMRGEPDLATPPHIVEACIRALKNGRTSYPDNRGEKSLRDAVVLKLHRDHGLTYDPETEILATTGATLGIYAALMALLDEGDEVLLPDPIYDAYQSPVRLAGGKIRSVASTISNGRFELDFDALEAAWSPKVKALILNTPWNPVGTVFTRPELEKLADFCIRRDVTLISDEIYETITYGQPHISPLSVAPELREHSVIVNSLSKTYAMTGWRVGYLVGPQPIVSHVLRAQEPTNSCINSPAQRAAVAAIRGDQTCVADMREAYARRASMVTSILDDHGVPYASPTGAFYTNVFPEADALKRSTSTTSGPS